MLIFSSLIFFSILLKLGLGRILISSTQLISSLRVVSMQEFLGIVFTTIFVTFIGMDFHQFLVSSKNSRESVKGSLFGGGILLILSLLLLTVVQGSLASGLVGQIKDAKQVVPAILFNFGKSKSYLLGLFFSLPIICVAVGSGSGVTKVVARAISEIGFKLRRGVDNRVVTIILAFTIALTGKSIIDLIVSFYAIYVGSVLIPFLIYVLADQLLIKITPINIQNSMIGGTFFSLLVFAGRFLPFLKDKIDSPQILIAGILGSSLCFSLSNFLHLHRIWRRK
jgi:SSS family solute:Na+ symporter